MRSLSFKDLAFVGLQGGALDPFPNDNFESYDDGADANGLNGGASGWRGGVEISWATAIVARSNLTGLQASDFFEAYAGGSALGGLSGGSGFSGAYVDHENPLGVKAQDFFETYAEGALVDISDGSGWAGDAVNHDN